MKTGTGSKTYPLSFEELLFSNKNKKYGAYILRKNYNKHLLIAFSTAVIIFTSGISLSFIINKNVLIRKPQFICALPAIPESTGKNIDIEKPVKLPGIKNIKYTTPQVLSNEPVTGDMFPAAEDLTNAQSSITIKAETNIDIINDDPPPPVVEIPDKVVQEYFLVEQCMSILVDFWLFILSLLQI